jgi:hypothetical protein
MDDMARRTNVDIVEEQIVLVQLFERAKRKLNRLAQSSWDFKVGRAAAKGFDALVHRKMYLGSSTVHELTRTSGEGADMIEKNLIAYARGKYGSRVRNQQLGGGPRADHHEHVVYLVEWPNPISEAGRWLFEVKPIRKRARW